MLGDLTVMSESILRVKSEPESCPSPSQVESQVSGIPFCIYRIYPVFIRL